MRKRKFYGIGLVLVLVAFIFWHVTDEHKQHTDKGSSGHGVSINKREAAKRIKAILSRKMKHINTNTIQQKKYREPIIKRNDNGDITEKVLADNSTINYSYDNGKLKSIEIPSRGTVEFTHRENGIEQATKVETPEGNKLFKSTNNVFRKKDVWRGEVNGAIEKDYYRDFKIGRVKIENGPTVDFKYDEDRDLIMAGGLDITYSGTESKKDVILTSLDSVSVNHYYDERGRIAETEAAYNKKQFYNVSYNRTASGKINQVARTFQGDTTNTEYIYNNNRLETVKIDNEISSTFFYDENVNITYKSVVIDGEEKTFTAVYNNLNQVERFGQFSYEFTPNGYLKNRTNEQTGKITEYIYDEFDNLLVVLLDDGRLLEYITDGANRRIGKKIEGELVQGFIYDSNDRVVAELDSKSNVVSTFIYGTSPYCPEYMIKDGEKYRIISDHKGSPLYIVETISGEIVQKMSYDAFGQVLEDTNPGFQPFGFAGGLYDIDTKLIRFEHRDYEPFTGRWVVPSIENEIFFYNVGDPVNYNLRSAGEPYFYDLEMLKDAWKTIWNAKENNLDKDEFWTAVYKIRTGEKSFIFSFGKHGDYTATSTDKGYIQNNKASDIKEQRKISEFIIPYGSTTEQKAESIKVDSIIVLDWDNETFDHTEWSSDASKFPLYYIEQSGEIKTYFPPGFTQSDEYETFINNVIEHMGEGFSYNMFECEIDSDGNINHGSDGNYAYDFIEDAFKYANQKRPQYLRFRGSNIVPEFRNNGLVCYKYIEYPDSTTNYFTKSEVINQRLLIDSSAAAFGSDWADLKPLEQKLKWQKLNENGIWEDYIITSVDEQGNTFTDEAVYSISSGGGLGNFWVGIPQGEYLLKFKNKNSNGDKITYDEIRFNRSDYSNHDIADELEIINGNNDEFRRRLDNKHFFFTNEKRKNNGWSIPLLPKINTGMNTTFSMHPDGEIFNANTKGVVKGGVGIWSNVKSSEQLFRESIKLYTRLWVHRKRAEQYLESEMAKFPPIDTAQIINKNEMDNLLSLVVANSYHPCLAMEENQNITVYRNGAYLDVERSLEDNLNMLRSTLTTVGETDIDNKTTNCTSNSAVNYAIIIEDNLYSQRGVKEKLQEYMADIASDYRTLLVVDDGQDPKKIRSLLKKLWESNKQGFEGAFLIGKIKAPLFSIQTSSSCDENGTNCTQTSNEEDIPLDMYYMDLDTEWNLDYYGNVLGWHQIKNDAVTYDMIDPDIYISRWIGDNSTGREELLDFFDRVHYYRKSISNNNALSYSIIHQDFFSNSYVSGHISSKFNLSKIYGNQFSILDQMIDHTWAKFQTNIAKNDLEFVLQILHSTDKATEFYIMGTEQGKNISSKELERLIPQTRFAYLYSCQLGNYMESINFDSYNSLPIVSESYLGGNGNAVALVSSTKYLWGGRPDLFIENLKQMRFGKAYLKHIRDTLDVWRPLFNSPNIADMQYTGNYKIPTQPAGIMGLVLYGDPTIKAKGNPQVATPYLKSIQNPKIFNFERYYNEVRDERRRVLGFE